MCNTRICKHKRVVVKVERSRRVPPSGFNPSELFLQAKGYPTHHSHLYRQWMSTVSPVTWYAYD